MNALVFRFPEACFVVLAGDIASFELASAGQCGVRESKIGPVHDLDAYLEGSFRPDESNGSSKHRIRHVAIDQAGRHTVFRSTASLHLVAIDRRFFFRLPRLVHESGCETWIRGIALWNESTLPSQTKKGQ